MPMYNLIEYASNYSETTGSLWFYLKDKATDFNADIVNTNDFKSFKYKAKILGNTVADGANGSLKNETVVVPLKYLNNFWKSLEIPIINCKVELELQSIAFCLQLVQITMMLLVIILFLLSKTQNYISCCNFTSKRQSKTIKIS